MEKTKESKLAERDTKIKDFVQKYTENFDIIGENLKKTILNSKAHDIYSDVSTRKYSSFDVVLIYCFACIEANKKTNCITEVMFEEAIAIAKYLDDHIKSTDKPVGPLHGVPFSIKDTFDIKDFDSTVGLVKYCFSAKTETSKLVQEIMKLGGIPFVKTNVPQTLMSFECSNPLWGITSNSLEKSLSPGGSSGGEAALIAAGGSIIGLGSDIGGSLRIPAHFSGIFSFKPSYNRLSNIGTTSYKPVHISVEPLMGPMATCVADLKLFCQSTFGHTAPDVMPLKFQTMTESETITFAYSRNYPFMDVSPACRRAVNETVEKLKAQGQNVIEYNFPASFERLATAFYEFMSADGWNFYFEKLKSEKREDNLKKLLIYASLPNWIKHTVAWLASLALRDKRAVGIIKSISRKDVYQIHKIQLEVVAIHAEFVKSIENIGIDVLIMPVHVLPATKNGSFGHIHFCAVHTFMWNLLNQPIGVMPITSFDETKDTVEGSWPRKFTFKDLFSKNLLDRAAQHWYNPDKIPNLPIGVQVIGKSHEDEKVLNAMELIEALVK